MDERQKALRDVAKASAAVDVARAAYGTALLRCVELKIPFVEIGKAAGKSEAAVRMYRTRAKEGSTRE